jgi:hypothetical protein
VNLTESARQWVLKNLPYDRGDAALVAYLNGLAAHGLLVVYHNWMNRLVKPQPRVVRKSKAFQLNPLTIQRASDLAQIIADIEQGRDLTKYLSRDRSGWLCQSRETKARRRASALRCLPAANSLPDRDHETWR